MMIRASCFEGENSMIRTTVQISGMTCGMCEAHINDAIRSAFPVKKVSSSRKEGKTVILSEKPIDAEELRQVIGRTGYIMISAGEETTEKKEKKWLLSLLKRSEAT